MYIVETVKYETHKSSENSTGKKIDQTWVEIETDNHADARKMFDELKNDVKGFDGYGVLISVGDARNGYDLIEEYAF